MAARYSAGDYAAAARALMPRGRVWPGTPDSMQGKLLGAIASALERLDETAVALLADAFPGRPDMLLAEWEESLGLPDICVGPVATIEQRQASVLARFIGGGGQSRSRFIEFAATLGFGVSITVYTPFRVGIEHAGDPVAGEEWAFAWSINVHSNTSGFSPAVLLCELSTLKPPETYVFIES